jgi:hypothetical protein
LSTANRGKTNAFYWDRGPGGETCLDGYGSRLVILPDVPGCSVSEEKPDFAEIDSTRFGAHRVRRYLPEPRSFVVKVMLSRGAKSPPRGLETPLAIFDNPAGITYRVPKACVEGTVAGETTFRARATDSCG